MRPVSDAFLRTIRGSHTVVARARVVTGHQTGVSPAGTVIPILAGNVQLDWTKPVRSTLDLTTDPALWPGRASDLLAPYGNEVFVERGVQMGDGHVEWVSLGYHRINTVEQQTVPYDAIRISAQDRMAGIVDGRLPQPRQWPSTATYGAVVNSLVQEIYPAATVEWDDATASQQIGRSVIADEDRYQFLDELIAGRGKVWWWDHRGILVIRDLPDPASPVWTIAGGAGGVLVEMSQSLTREGVCNAIVARGEGVDTTAPAWGIATDSGVDSPTRWGGPFGRVPRFYSSPLITSDAQARLAAASLLKRYVGLPYNVDWTAVPNPALEPLDPIVIKAPGAAPMTHIVDTLTIPLTAEQAMRGTTREQTLVTIGQVV